MMNKKILLFSTALWFATPAFSGLPEALMSLNYKQYANALAEFQELANQDNAAALYYLGRMYQNGWGVTQNIQQAISYFQAADRAFYLPAAAQLGKILLYGAPGVPANPQKAIPLLKKAALAGDDEAAFELGSAALAGLGDSADYNHAFGFYAISALKGNKKAQFQISQMYLVGRGIPQNYVKAIQWLSRSANQGYVKSQLELANLREKNSQLKNLGEAYAWNSILAAYNSDAVGAAAAKKRDELASKLKAKELAKWQTSVKNWKPKTAEQSVPKEEREHAVLPIIPGFNDPKTLQQILLSEGMLPQDASDFGLTLEQIDLAEATGDTSIITKTIEKAIQDKQIKAAAYYGDILNHRLHNPTEALTWYGKGAALGDTYAQYQLAKAHCEGWTGTADTAECYRWLLSISDTPDPVLNGLTQQALMAVRANATAEELERGEELLKKSQQKEAKDKKDKKILDFF